MEERNKEVPTLQAYSIIEKCQPSQLCVCSLDVHKEASTSFVSMVYALAIQKQFKIQIFSCMVYTL